MNLKQLEAFYLVAKRGSCTKAADELNVTPSAVTMQVKSLEKSLDLKLLQHVGKNFQLSEAGELLYHYADDFFSLVREAEEKMRDFKTLMRGTLRIGTTKNERYITPSLLTAFQSRFPTIKIILEEANSEDLAKSILNGKNDLAFVARINFDKKICSIPFTTIELSLIASCHHRFSKRESISLRELKGEPIILREKGSGSRVVILNKLAQYDIDPLIILETGNLDLIVESVAKGNGVFFIFSPLIKEKLDRGILRVIPIEEGNIFLEYVIIYHSEKSLSPPAQALLKIIEDLKGEFVFPNTMVTH